MKFTGFIVPSPIGKLKALLILFNNCFVYGNLPLNAKLLIMLCFFTVFLLNADLFAVQSPVTKQLLTSISVDIRIYQPSKVVFTSASTSISVDISTYQPSNVIFTSASGLSEYHF